MTSALPAAVRKQIAAANKIAAQVYPTEGQAAPAPAAPPPAPTVTIEGQPPAAPAPAPAAAAPPPAAPAPAPAPAAPAPSPTGDWEQKYKVLQGKYNAEVPRLQDQNRELLRQLREKEDDLLASRQLLASFGAQQASAPAATGGTPAPSSKLVKDEEVKEFGPDLYDFIKRTAREVIAPEVESRVRPVAAKVEQVASTATAVAREGAKTAEQRVRDMLTEQVPEWTILDTDAGFLAWLDEVDPFAGQKRGVLLREAYQRHDGPRVVTFFKAYLKENAAVTPPAPTPAPAAAQPAPQVSLESMVAPGVPKTGTAGAQDGAGKRIWTRAEITAFFKAKSNGTFNRRAEEAKAIEADIFAAQREGRVR